MTTSKESKRIDKVTVKRIPDYDGDTSWLGEYSDTPEDYAIVAAYGEYQGEFVSDLPCECSHLESEHDEDGECLQCRGNDDGCTYFDRVEIPRGREYRYFNPPADNYKGEPEADIRKYCQQDYKRMEGLNRGDWGFVGVKAEAQITLQVGVGLPEQGIPLSYGPIQTITSGGLWGIESDSEENYFDEVGKEQLAELKDQLHALGFSKRAISAAFRNVERESD